MAGAIGASFGKVFYYKNGSPFLSAILAVVFLGEAMNEFIFAGAAMIVFGIVIIAA